MSGNNPLVELDPIGQGQSPFISGYESLAQKNITSSLLERLDDLDSIPLEPADTLFGCKGPFEDAKNDTGVTLRLSDTEDDNCAANIAVRLVFNQHGNLFLIPLIGEKVSDLVVLYNLADQDYKPSVRDNEPIHGSIMRYHKVPNEQGHQFSFARPRNTNRDEIAQVIDIIIRVLRDGEAVHQNA
jgi:hypothetical protein